MLKRTVKRPPVYSESLISSAFLDFAIHNFARPAIYEALETRGVGYAIRIPANKNLELEIEDILFRSPAQSHALVRYKSFHYQADSWTTPKRVVAKVDHHAGELFPRVGFIVTNPQPREPLAAAGVPGADRRVLGDQSPAAPRQDGWALGQARTLLLVAACRKSI